MALSLQSDALEPTRAELAGLSTSERIRRLLPVYGLPLIALLLIALFSALFSRHVSDARERERAYRQQSHHRVAVHGGARSDGCRQDRSHDRLRNRTLAHSRDQPATELSYAMVGRGFPGPSARRRLRPDQCASGRVRPDRRFCRDARHRHHHLCDCPLVHGRQTGRRAASCRLQRDRWHSRWRPADQRHLRIRAFGGPLARL